MFHGANNQFQTAKIKTKFLSIKQQKSKPNSYQSNSKNQNQIPINERKSIRKLFFLLIFIFSFCPGIFSASYTNYVDGTVGAPVAPYTNEAQAANFIQDAIDAINNDLTGLDLTDNGGDDVTILVKNGIYNELVDIDNYICGAGNGITIKNYSGHSPVLSGLGLLASPGIVINQVSYVTIQGLIIRDVDDGAVNASGIRCNGPLTTVVIRDCTIYNILNIVTPNRPGGINVSGDCSFVYIINNTIYNCNNGIRTSGNNIYITSNRSYNNRKQGIRIGTSAIKTYISYNDVYGNVSHGIAIASSPSNIIWNNYIHDNTADGINISGGFSEYNLLHNNLIANNTGDGFQWGDTCNYNRIVNNTIYNNDENGINATNANATNNTVANNIISHNGGLGIGDSPTNYWAAPVDYNLFYLNGTTNNIDDNYGSNNVIGVDPQYMSTVPGSLNFLKIISSSTCIDRGDDPANYGMAVSSDYWGQIRPFDLILKANYQGPYDIGADEYFIPVYPNRFMISHDTYASPGVPEMITITALNSNNQVVTIYTGTITVDVSSFNGGSITWTNGGNQGSFNDLGGGSFEYDFSKNDWGIVTFYITDDTTDSVDIDIHTIIDGSDVYDDELEGLLYFDFPPVISINKVKISPIINPSPGEYVRYRIDYTNTGGRAYDVIITDTIPNGTVYVAGSMTNSEYGDLTDKVSDDRGSFFGNQITFCPGEGGQAPGTPGLLAPNKSGSLFFTVQVNIDVSISTQATIILDNSAQDGEIRDNGSGISDNGTRIPIGNINGNPREVEAYLGFNIGSIPTGCTITSATLGFYIINVVDDPNSDGLNPYRVDHVDFGTNLNLGDQTPFIEEQFHSFDYPGNNRWYTLSCITQIISAYNNAKAWALDGSDKWFQVRIRPNNASAEKGDKFYIVAKDDDGNPTLHPYIKVAYEKFVIAPDIITNTVQISGANFTQTSATLVTIISQAGVLEPSLRISKSVLSPAGAIAPGDYVRYRIDYTNTGTGSATGVLITDTIPNNTIYSAESLESSANGALGDGSADTDEGYYDSGSNQVIFTVEGGSAPGTGGTLSAGASGSVYFTVQINSNTSVPAGSVTIPLDNPAQDGEMKEQGSLPVDNLDSIPCGGQENNGREFEAYQGYKLDAIPFGVTVTSATIGFYIISVTGDPNSDGLNPYRVDHVDFGTNIDSLDAGTFITQAFFSFNYPYGEPTWFYIPCGSQVSNAFESPKSWTLDDSDKWFQVRYRPNDPSKDKENRFYIVASDDTANSNFHSYLTVYYSGGTLPIPEIVTNNVTISADNAASTNAILINNITTATASSVSISLSKSLTAVTLDGSGISSPIPGATVTYSIKFSNQGPGIAANVIIRDPIQQNTIYWTNGASGSWQVQYATAGSADQTWGSTNYTNCPPPAGSRPSIRWIRWINASVPVNETATFDYTVIVK